MIGKAGLQGLLGFGDGLRLANSALLIRARREMRDHVTYALMLRDFGTIKVRYIVYSLRLIKSEWLQWIEQLILSCFSGF
jgi:hypothetical protein